MVSRGLIKAGNAPHCQLFYLAVVLRFHCFRSIDDVVFYIDDVVLNEVYPLLIVSRWFYKNAGIFYLIGSLYGLTDDLQLVIKILAFYIA